MPVVHDRLAIVAGLTAALFIVAELLMQKVYGGRLSEAVAMVTWHGATATASISAGFMARTGSRATLLGMAFLASLPATVIAGLPIVVTLLISVALARLGVRGQVRPARMMATGLLAAILGLASPWIPVAGILAWPLGSVAIAVGWHFNRRLDHNWGIWLIALGVAALVQPIVLLAFSYTVS